MMDNNSTAAKSRNARFVPFFILIVIAVAIGFAIRHFINSKEVIPEQKEVVPEQKEVKSLQSQLEVYFSEVDGAATGPTLEERLVHKLTDATADVDAALYHLDAMPIATALINAHNREVDVRVFTENRNVEEDEIQRLLSAGIPVRDDGDDDGYMHHKFVVIDKRYVWTGSYNTTYRGAHTNDNNVVWIDSVPLAENFTKEFETIYTSRGREKLSGWNIPNPQVTLSDGTQITTYFSPGSETISPLLREINSAEKSIFIMAFMFTQNQLGEAICHQFKSGILTEVVFDDRAVNTLGSEYEKFVDTGVKIKVVKGQGTMHHKVMIIDEETVITGSYNFSRNAEIRNSENLLIIKGNKDIASAYIGEYNRLK